MKKQIIYLIFCLIFVHELSAQTDATQSVEVMPTFPGGEVELFKFLDKTMIYPEMAREQGIQGKVWIGFLIDKEGKVSDVVILRGIGGGCDEEAKRVVELMPNWNPGMLNGQPVDVKFRFPINFVLTDLKKNKKNKKKN